jgi:hypothetical protein
MKEIYIASEKSGKIFVIGTLFGSMIACLLTIMYIHVTFNVHDLFLSPLAYIIYLLLLMGIIYILNRLSLCRSKISSYIFSTLLSVITIYFHWFYWVFLTLSSQKTDQSDPLSLFLNPWLIVHHLDILSHNIYSTIMTVQITGWILWLMWILEALGILVIGFIGNKISIYEKVFCENCEKWVPLTLRMMFIYDTEEELNTLLDSDLIHILKLIPTLDFKQQHILINIHKCSDCDSTITLNIDKKIGELTSRYDIPIDAKYRSISPVFFISSSLYDRFFKINEYLTRY